MSINHESGGCKTNKRNQSDDDPHGRVIIGISAGHYVLGGLKFLHGFNLARIFVSALLVVATRYILKPAYEPCSFEYVPQRVLSISGHHQCDGDEACQND